MRIIRRLLLGLAVVIVLGALLVGTAFLPAVQTWFAERELARLRGLHASLKSLAVVFSTIRVTERQEPVADWVHVYADAYPRYRALYPALKAHTVVDR